MKLDLNNIDDIFKEGLEDFTEDGLLLRRRMKLDGTPEKPVTSSATIWSRMTLGYRKLRFTTSVPPTAIWVSSIELP